MISIYCSPTHIKIVEGSADSSKINLKNYFSAKIPEGAMINGIITDEDLMTKALGDLNDEFGFTRDDASLVIETNNIVARPMNIPVVNEAQVLDFVKQEFSQYGEQEGDEEMVYDYTVIDPKAPSGGAVILAVAAGKELLETYKKVFISAGYKLDNINIGINTQIKLARFLPELRDGTYILALVDGKVLSFTLFDDGQYDLNNKYRLLNADSTPEWYNELGDNLSSLLQFSKGQKEHKEIKTVFFAGISEDDMLHLNQNFSYLGVNIKRLSLGDYVQLSETIRAKGGFDPSEYLYNIGNLLKK